MNRINMAHPDEGDVTYIISAEREALGPSASMGNALAMRRLAKRLESLKARGLAYTVQPVAGAYQGRPEESVAVIGPDTLEFADTIRAIGRWFGQDSVLAIDSHARGFLEFSDGRRTVSIGIMAQLDAASLASATAFSAIKATGEAFTFA